MFGGLLSSSSTPPPIHLRSPNFTTPVDKVAGPRNLPLGSSKEEGQDKGVQISVPLFTVVADFYVVTKTIAWKGGRKSFNQLGGGFHHHLPGGDVGNLTGVSW